MSEDMKQFEQRIRERLVIDETSPSGLKWNHLAGKKARGKQAGAVTHYGYWNVGVSENGVAKKFLAHRIIWFLAYGHWPDGEIDHVNGNRADNRLSNIREASHSENACNSKMRSNNSSGTKGVYFNKSVGKWQSQITVDGKHTYLGLFTDIADAKNAVMCAREKLHGIFANNGLHTRETK